jgi:predicted flap endonuclease-1-like 5' DNA nuclease
MSSIDSIEGIGPVFAEKLQSVNIQTVADLLRDGATTSGRKNLSEQTGFSTETILKWVNMADLMRIDGVGGQYAELLEKSGVDTVKELRNRNAENLVFKMEEVNSEMNLVNKTPALSQVEDWINEAKTLEPVIEY